MKTDNLSQSDDSATAASSSLGWMKALKQAAGVNLPPTPVAIQSHMGAQHGVTQIVMVPHGMSAQQGVPMYVSQAHSQPILARRQVGNMVSPNGHMVASRGTMTHRRSASSSGVVSTHSVPSWLPNQPEASLDTGAAVSSMSEMPCTSASVMTSGAAQTSDGMYMMTGSPHIYHMQRKQAASMSEIVLGGTAAGTPRRVKQVAFHSVEGQDELRGEAETMFSFGEVAGPVQAPKRQRRRHTSSGGNLSFGDVPLMAADDEMDVGAFAGGDLANQPQICGEPMSWLVGAEVVGQPEIGCMNEINELMVDVAERQAEGNQGDEAVGRAERSIAIPEPVMKDDECVPVLDVIKGQGSLDEERMRILMSDDEAKGMFADLLADLSGGDSGKMLPSPPFSPIATSPSNALAVVERAFPALAGAPLSSLTEASPASLAVRPNQQQQEEEKVPSTVSSQSAAPAPAGVAAGVAAAAKMAAAAVSATIASVQVVSRGPDADSLILRCDSVSSSKTLEGAYAAASQSKSGVKAGSIDLPVMMGASADAIWKEALLALEKSLQSDGSSNSGEAVPASTPTSKPASFATSALPASKSCEPLRPVSSPSTPHSAGPFPLTLSRSFNASNVVSPSPAASPLLTSAGLRRPLVVTSSSSGSSSGSSVSGQKRLLELPVMKPLMVSSAINGQKKEQAVSRPSRMPLLRMPDLNALPSSRPVSSGAPAANTTLQSPLRSPMFSSPASHSKPRCISPLLTHPSRCMNPAAGSARPLGFPAKPDRRAFSFGNASELSAALKAPLRASGAPKATPADSATAGILEGLVDILTPAGQDSTDLVAAIMDVVSQMPAVKVDANNRGQR